MSGLKRIARGLVTLLALVLVGNTFSHYWQDLGNIQWSPAIWGYSAIALIIRVVAFSWLAILWGLILKNLQYPVSRRWAVSVYLTNELNKYLPGNIWQLYGRVRSAQQIGIPLSVGTASIVLEPLLMITAATGLGLLMVPQWHSLAPLSLLFGCLLLGLHPQVLSWMTQAIASVQQSQFVRSEMSRLIPAVGKPITPIQMQQYPLHILLGQFLFIGLRSLAFVFTAIAFTPVPLTEMLPLMGGFSLAWIISIVLPLTPGGIGIFEAASMQLLGGMMAPTALVYALILYRVISVLTEVIGAGLGWLIQGQQQLASKALPQSE
jgi:hypothetical protein